MKNLIRSPKFWERKNESAEAINRLTDTLIKLDKARVKGARKMNKLLTDPAQLGRLFQRALAASQPQPEIGVQPVQAPRIGVAGPGPTPILPPLKP